MTRDDYWQALALWYDDALSPAEQYQYQLAGIIAESRARERGSSLLPYPMRQEGVEPKDLDRDTAIVLGLTALVFAGMEAGAQ